MVEKRKVRKDFDPKQSISVDVSNCTEEEKKEVQQAFYDVGIKWESGVMKIRYLTATSYTNSTKDGTWYDHLMYGTLPRTDSISRQQFLSMVYEPEQQGHVHADLMAQYAEDAKTHAEPWKFWQVSTKNGAWLNLFINPTWDKFQQYRRKPKTHNVHGIEIPDLRVSPNFGDHYYLADPVSHVFTTIHMFANHKADRMWVERGLTYQDTEEGKQAAILHAKAWLGIA